jgi:hypothetical protein
MARYLPLIIAALAVIGAVPQSAVAYGRFDFLYEFGSECS